MSNRVLKLQQTDKECNLEKCSADLAICCSYKQSSHMHAELPKRLAVICLLEQQTAASQSATHYTVKPQALSAT